MDEQDEWVHGWMNGWMDKYYNICRSRFTDNSAFPKLFQVLHLASVISMAFPHDPTLLDTASSRY